MLLHSPSIAAIAFHPAFCKLHREPRRSLTMQTLAVVAIQDAAPVVGARVVRGEHTVEADHDSTKILEVDGVCARLREEEDFQYKEPDK